LLTAAGAAGYASRPILLFYGLSQAGRAIAAASTAADNNTCRLSGHGIKVLDLDQRPPLPGLTVKDDGLGSFTQLARMLGSVSLRDCTPLGQIWATIPDLLTTPLEPMPPRHLPVLQLQPNPGPTDADGRFVQRNAVWIAGLPLLSEGYRPGHLTKEEMSAILSNYPALAGIRPLWEEGWHEAREHSRERNTVRILLSAFPDELGQPYRDDRDRWVFPPLDDRGEPLHPLLAWWALLFALSMLARYEPASWISALEADASPNAVPLEAALDHALDTCPELILRAISAVSS
jgi:hypothetical protein